MIYKFAWNFSNIANLYPLHAEWWRNKKSYGRLHIVHEMLQSPHGWNTIRDLVEKILRLIKVDLPYLHYHGFRIEFLREQRLGPFQSNEESVEGRVFYGCIKRLEKQNDLIKTCSLSEKVVCLFYLPTSWKGKPISHSWCLIESLVEFPICL